MGTGGNQSHDVSLPQEGCQGRVGTSHCTDMPSPQLYSQHVKCTSARPGCMLVHMCANGMCDDGALLFVMHRLFRARFAPSSTLKSNQTEGILAATSRGPLGTSCGHNWAPDNEDQLPWRKWLLWVGVSVAPPPPRPPSPQAPPHSHSPTLSRL